MKLYLEIDGVLLDRDGGLIDGAEKFLEWAVSNCSCYWLTTRDKNGLYDGIQKALASQLPEKLVRSIILTQWTTLKSEAVLVSGEEYCVIDSSPLAADKAVYGLNWFPSFDSFLAERTNNINAAFSTTDVDNTDSFTSGEAKKTEMEILKYLSEKLQIKPNRFNQDSGDHAWEGIFKEHSFIMKIIGPVYNNSERDYSVFSGCIIFIDEHPTTYLGEIIARKFFGHNGWRGDKINKYGRIQTAITCYRSL
jgi:hypothetical protein